MKLVSIFVAVALAASPVWSSDTQRPILGPSSSISQPFIGFGTWNLKLSDENTTAAVSEAIQIGYRQIDCAAIYGNEKAVGSGIVDGLKKANITREQIWITSKLWNDHHGDPSLVEAGLERTLLDLGLDYLDLYLMHWPVGNEPGTKETHLEYVETWRSMIALPKTKVRNIGISNFSPHQLRKLISSTGVTPFAHQMELHPYLQQSAWLTAHQALGISVTAYSPLANSNPIYDSSSRATPPPLLQNDLVGRIAEKRNCTPAQVALSWGIGRGTSVIPKSSHVEHIRENFAASACELKAEDLAEIKLMERDYVKRFSNPSENWGVTLFEGLEDA